MRAGFAICGALVLTSCHVIEFRGQDVRETSAVSVYMAALGSLCNGQAYAGELVSRDQVDAGFREQLIVMGPATCSDGEVRIPLSVGEDRSRTWVVTRTKAGVRLKHDHRHRDGRADQLTQYGGDSSGDGDAIRQIFPVDAPTRALFTREGIAVSNQNTWAIEIRPEEGFIYEMWRPDRHFKIEFDLSEPVAAPPLPWGMEPVE